MISVNAASNEKQLLGPPEVSRIGLDSPSAVTNGSDVPMLRPRDAIVLSEARPATSLVAAKSMNDAPGGAAVGASSTLEKVNRTIAAGIGIAAKDGTGALAKVLSDPKAVALIGAGAAAAIGVQFIPVVGEAVDVVAGVAGVAMYAAAGPEHRARIGQALGEFKQYLHSVSGATSQADLDAAAHHFAKFLEIGGSEAADGLLTVAGAAAAPARFAGMLAKVKEIGGLEGVARLGASGLSKLGSLADSARSLGRDSIALASRSWDAVAGAVAAAPGTLSAAGKTAWHAVQGAGDAVTSTLANSAATLEHGWNELVDSFSPQLATAGAPMRVPSRVAQHVPTHLEMTAAPSSGSRGTVRLPRASAADVRETGKASAAAGIAASHLLPAERTLADGTRVARGVAGGEKRIVELSTFDDYKRVAKGHPEPDRIYRFDGKSYETDAQGRPIASSGTLRTGGASRRISGADTEIGAGGLPGDVGFHHGGDQFGFGGGRLNLSPGNGSLNGGEYKRFEGFLRRQADTGHTVTARFEAAFTRANTTDRPNGYVVRYSIDGGPVQERAFYNPRR